MDHEAPANPGTGEREQALFAAALERPPEERTAFLDGACQADPKLRQRLEALLAAHEQPATELAMDGESTVKADAGIEFIDEAVGQTIGRYKLLEKIGEGGYGVVYVAEQTEPVRRRVALKVIKLGMDTKQVVARFEAERQALALMDHPNIAKVLDAGTTEHGRPYFVMELVRGIRITEYCDQNNLPTRDRLDLFTKVCHAIQHAHQKGIIHRDIKPSNILVTLHDGVPVPKVIDFGIAKATEGRLTDATVYTQLHQFIGTPAYMSPEQAEMSGLDIDTRSDIYSLGVLLYELLTGRTPFDGKELMSMGLDAMRKTIRETEPARPSTRLATLPGEDLTTTAKRRSVDTSRLLHQLRGDLDWIVMKCLEKDRSRRYDTANGLAMDLKRHQSNEPVVARPPSTAYRLQKAWRRNKLAFAAASAVAAALLIGLTLSLWQAGEANAQRELASQEKAEKEVQRLAAVAKADEADRERRRAEELELLARRRAYASDMSVAGRLLREGNLGGAVDRLNRQRPSPGEVDLRGWEWRYLWEQTRSDALFTVSQQSCEISSVAVSSDGRLLAHGVVHRGGITVWDLQTRKEVAQLAPKEAEGRVAFSPTGPLLAFTSSTLPGLDRKPVKCTLRLWDSVTRRVLAEIPVGEQCQGLSFSQDGRTLVTSARESDGRHNIRLWQVPEGNLLATYPSQQTIHYLTTGFAASPDLRHAAYGSGESVRVMNLRDGREAWAAVASDEHVTALAFSPDAKTLATAAGWTDSEVRLWDVATGTEIGRLQGHQAWVGSLVFWPDGRKLASASADQTIRVWDVAQRSCTQVLRGHRQEVWRLALSPDNRTLASGSKDGEVSLWDTSQSRARRGYVCLPEMTAAWGFQPEDRSILTINWEGEVVQWSGPDLQQTQPLPEISPGPVDSVLSATFSDDCRFLACGSPEGRMSVWDVSQRRLWREFRPANKRVYPLRFLAQNSRLIVLAVDEQRLLEWDLLETQETQSWTAPRPGFFGWGISPEERVAVWADQDGDVVLRDLPGRTSTSPRLDILEASDVAFSPYGEFLAMGSYLGYARVWDTRSWSEEVTLRGFLNACGCAAFSPDGDRLVTGSSGHDALKIWAVGGWQEVFGFPKEGRGFDKVGFSPDGNLIAAWPRGGDLHVWQAPSWEEIAAAERKEKQL